MTEPRYPYVHVDVDADAADETSATLWELGAQGVEERDASTLSKNAAAGKVTLVASFASRDEAEAAMAEIADLAPRYEEVVGDAWRDAWKEHFKPFAIVDGLVVRPPWEPYDAKPGEKVLELEPGRAFGTGLHETTRLVTTAIREHQARIAGATVLDVGCGSGILALAALVLGAGRAVAIDVDPEAIEVTVENAARNGLSARVEASTTAIEDCDTVAPLVLANIEARVLVPMADALVRHVAKGGLLLLSGILASQADEVRAAYQRFDDLRFVAGPQLGEWVLLAFERA